MGDRPHPDIQSAALERVCNQAWASEGHSYLVHTWVGQAHRLEAKQANLA
ncbi:MAG: hypothetical protein NVS3B14_10380 [Ktedonobacteraceae bacterium]